MKKITAQLTCLCLGLIVFSSCHQVIEPLPGKPEPTKTELLVRNNWELKEVWRNINGQNKHYIRDSINNTGTEYDNIRLLFNPGGTGTYVDEVSISHTLDWKFISSEQRDLELRIGPPSQTTFIWNIVEISDSSLTNTTAFGPNILVSARYIPIKKAK